MTIGETKVERAKRHFKNLENELLCLDLFGDKDTASDLCQQMADEFDGDSPKDISQARVWKAIKTYLRAHD